MTDSRRHIVVRLGAVFRDGNHTIIVVECSDGSTREIALPSALNGALIEQIQTAFMPNNIRQRVELDVLRIGLARGDKDQVAMILHTATAHDLICNVPRTEAESLRDMLEGIDDLPTAHPEKSN